MASHVPLALGNGRSTPRAIGGLLTATILTLIVLPVLYEWVEARWLHWRQPLA